MAKTGVAGTFQHGGVLDGLCSVQFLLAFLGKGEIRIKCFEWNKATRNINLNSKKKLFS